MDELNPLWLLLLTAALGLAPMLAGLATAYLKISIVLSLCRSGLGAQQVPGGLAIMALALTMTLLVMAPVLEESRAAALRLDFSPLLKQPTAERMPDLAPLLEPWRLFLERHAGAREKAALAALASAPSAPEMPSDGWAVLLPAFVLSEIKEGFAMGFVLLLPFLVIDLTVASILAGMGMYMVSPVMIALPLKLILFVACDGWLLLTRSLVASYRL